MTLCRSPLPPGGFKQLGQPWERCVTRDKGAGGLPRHLLMPQFPLLAGRDGLCQWGFSGCPYCSGQAFSQHARALGCLPGVGSSDTQQGMFEPAQTSATGHGGSPFPEGHQLWPLPIPEFCRWPCPGHSTALPGKAGAGATASLGDRQLPWHEEGPWQCCGNTG